MNNTKRIYLSGPITNNPNAHQLFADAEAIMSNIGYEVVNPLHIAPPNVDWHTAMRYDIKALVECDAILLLPGWIHSKGARIEYYIASKIGLKTLHFTRNCKIYDTYSQRNIIVDEIIDAINSVLGISIDILQSETRKNSIVDARRIFCLLMRHMGIDSPTIAGRILNISHCTVIYHYRRGNELLIYDRKFAEKYEKVKHYLKKAE